MTALSGPQFEQFLQDFRQHHQRLRSLIAPTSGDLSAPATSTVDLIREIDEIGEQLLVADEELRVQSEQLASAQDNLADVLSAFEHLFMNAPVPYVQTDTDGVIVRLNRAANRMISATYGGKPHTLVSLFRMSDRAKVRELLSRVRNDTVEAGRRRNELPAIEVALSHADTAMPVVLSAQLVVPGDAAEVVHWEIRPRPAAAPERTAPAAGGLAAVVQLTDALKEIAAAPELHDMADRMTAAARSVVPGCTATALLLRRARDRAEVASSSDLAARSITDLQRSLREGPAVEALRTGSPVRTNALTVDQRWPRLAEANAAAASVLAVPLVGPRGPFGALVCYSPEQRAFDVDAEVLAASLANQTALLYAARELEANLRAGMETRERIGQAVGVLMERHRLTSQQAFDLLVYVSQRTHRKLREIANWVTETGEDPQVFMQSAQRE